MDAWFFNTEYSLPPLTPSSKPEYTDDIDDLSDDKKRENNMKHDDEYGDSNYTPAPHQKSPKRKPARTSSPSPAAKQSTLTTSYSPTKPKPQARGKGKDFASKASNIKSPVKHRTKATSSRSNTKFTKEEISDLFDMLTDAVESGMWKEIVETLNTRYGKQRRADNVRYHWKGLAKAKVVAGYN